MKAWRLGAGAINATLRLLGAPTYRWRSSKDKATKAGMAAKSIIHDMRVRAAKQGVRCVVAPFLGEQRLAVPEPQFGRYTQNDEFYKRIAEQQAAIAMAWCGTGLLADPVIGDVEKLIADEGGWYSDPSDAGP